MPPTPDWTPTMAEAAVARRRARGRDRSELFQVQTQLLGLAVFFERELDETLAYHLSRDSHTEALLLSTLPKLSIDGRLGLLEDLLSVRGYDVYLPLLVPVAKRMFFVRNLVAHSYADIGAEPLANGDRIITFRNYRRGKPSTHTIPLGEISAATRSAHALMSDLVRLWAMGERDYNDFHVDEG